MSDSGFPPFRSAQPKGQKSIGKDPVLAAPIGQPIEGDPYKKLAEEVAEVGPYREIPEGTTIQHITVCAKCGSREVREAVLIGEDVYVKL